MIGWGVCVLALALADRYLLKRKDITHLGKVRTSS